MVSCFVSLFLASALGQAPPATSQAAWLKAIPADAAAVVRVKALETGRDDLLKMVEAMSGNAAALLKPQLEQGLATIASMHGKSLTQHPFLAVLRLPKDGPMPAWAVIMEGDYDATLKAISKKDDLKPKSLGGYDSFDGPDGQTWFGTKGAGFAAFGPDEPLIKAISKPDASLSEKISDDLKASLLAGDVGVYLNIAAIQSQYGDQIENAKQMAMGLLDQQAGAQLNEGMKQGAKSVYGVIFDSFKVGDALALNLDFAAEGLAVSGLATVKADSAAAKKLTVDKAGAGDMIGKLPANSTVFAYMNVNPENAAGLLKFATTMMSGQAKPSPELEKALATMSQAGAAETYSASSSSGVPGLGTESITLSFPKDPAKAVEAATELAKAGKGPGGMVKEVVINADAQKYKGFTLNENVTTFDLEKMVTPGAPGGVEALKKAMGGDTVHTFYGTDGKAVLSVVSRSFDSAKKLIDSTLSGEDGIDKSPNFKALRARLPKQVGTLFFLSAQGLVKQTVNQLAATTGKDDMKVPADMPKETALLGGALTGSPKGYSFQFFVPANVGPVIEKGLLPAIQSMQGQIQ